jgi:hypothetical protein
MTIRLVHGNEQRFRFRCPDITIRGRIEDRKMPIVAAGVTLNGSASRPLYVEQDPDAGVDWVHAYKATPAELRCREQGEFCIEIAAIDPALREGSNDLQIWARDSSGQQEKKTLHFHWDPDPLPLPLDLRDLSRFSHIQDVGQAVNGAFDLDRDMNVIRSRSPVAPDALLVLGSPHTGQEATYSIRFLELSAAKWLGCSDFFAGLTEGVPWRGIRVGWCSAGMAAFSPNDGARSFIAWGDHSGDQGEWAIATNPAKRVSIEKGRLYGVRHQVAFANGTQRVRWRIWPSLEPEPDQWLCEEESARVPVGLPRPANASFSLFQHLGYSIEWSDIFVREYSWPPGDEPGRDPARSRKPFLKRDRPGAF